MEHGRNPCLHPCDEAWSAARVLAGQRALVTATAAGACVVVNYRAKRNDVATVVDGGTLYPALREGG